MLVSSQLKNSWGHVTFLGQGLGCLSSEAKPSLQSITPLHTVLLGIHLLSKHQNHSVIVFYEYNYLFITYSIINKEMGE
jgi:hypothetical protein